MTKKVILLFGGQNEERLVSVASAQNMLEAVDNPTIWFWAPEGQVFKVTANTLASHQKPFNTPFCPTGKPAFATIEEALDSNLAKDSIFLLAVHGIGCEDGVLQHLFETRNISFTGSSAKVSEIAFDKIKTKELVKKHDIKTAEYVKFNGHNKKLTNDTLSKFLSTHKKIFIKPVASGSTVGAQVIEREGPYDLLPVEYLAEPFLVGTELSIGVIDHNNELFALPCTEIRTKKGRVFDYDGKYLGNGSEEITPAEIPNSMANAAKEMAIKAHKVIGCSGPSRTDIIVTKDGPVFLEINTLPGLARQSIIPKQLDVLGISMKSFLAYQISSKT